MSKESTKAFLQACLAYSLWGIFPLFWKALKHVSSYELLLHRVVWSAIVLIIVARVFGVHRKLLPAFKKPKIILVYFLSGLLVALNWVIYIWAVNNGRILESSLGYYICPLLTAFLGVFVFSEKLLMRQWISLAIMFAALLYLTISYGDFPWVALSLASTFALYVLIRKLGPLESLAGLTLETCLIAPIAFVLLFNMYNDSTLSFGFVDRTTDVLISLAGVVTVAPLVLFHKAARNLELTLIGILQYLNPTVQFLLGVMLFDEKVSTERFYMFLSIWLAIIVYISGALKKRKLQFVLSS